MNRTEPTVSEAEAVARLRDFVDSLPVRPQAGAPAHAGPLAEDDTATDAWAGAPEDAWIEAVGPPDAAAGDPIAWATATRGGGRRAVALAVAATLVLVATVFGGLRVLGPPSYPAAGGGITLPEELPAYRHFSIPLGWLPPGRILLSYQHGGDYEFLDATRHIVLGADGSTVRTLGIAQERSALGQTAPTSVSPDGRYVAVGTRGWSGDVVLVDAQTGEERTVPVTSRPQRAVLPQTWSPDGAWLYVLDIDANRPDEGQPGVLHRIAVDSAQGQDVPGVGGAEDVTGAYAGAADRLLLLRNSGTTLLDVTTGATVRTYRDSFARSLEQNAWSPDGRYLVSSGTSGLVVEDLITGQTRQLTGANGSGLAWVDDRTYLVEESRTVGSNRNSDLVEVDIHTGQRWLVSAWGDTWTGAAVIDPSIAAGLVWHWRAHRSPLPSSGAHRL